ncbi:diaminopimelate epimerase [Caloramator fervidus]|uniref:Diaminopimelate epimerase n=1 Tax=Caloramator fervidus TaxID=29344 RepID=A0A1H5U177_9CLOT|nr:diaminopimelate epimerase [Caloramator fervidus]SEF68178.1 diaminopimelate epimerase [Caloramator fervidus]
MYFAKMHGLGNDFIIIENLEENFLDYSKIATKVCNRHFGIGADGLLVVEKSDKADIKMLIFNSDGSQAEMCGNGIRCFAKYVYEKKIVSKNIIDVETLAGVLKAELRVINSKVDTVRINMGKPVIDKISSIYNSNLNNLNYDIKIDNKVFKASTILMGVPHTVIYVNEIDENEILFYGPKIEKLDIFPNRTNVNFVKIVDEKRIQVRTWERGAGLTLACGTGSCAAVVACYLNGLTYNLVNVELAFGKLKVEYIDDVYMEGPAEFICEGNFVL